MQERHEIGLAIVAGFAAIGVVVHLGLKGVAEAVRASVDRSGQQTAPAQVITPPTAEPRSPAPVPPPLDPTVLARDHDLRTEELVLEALSQQKGEYAKACWKSVAGDMRVRQQLQIRLSLDAQGHETGRELIPAGRAPQAFVDCVLRQKLAPLAIRAPGKPVTVTVSIYVP